MRVHSSNEYEDVTIPMLETDSRKRKAKWVLDTLKEAEYVVNPKKTVKERKPPERFSSYVA